MKKILETLKHKWAEYLLETLVIIVGVIGAFELNNWKEDRTNKKQQIAYLKGMIDDIDADYLRLEEGVELENRKRVSGNYIIKHFKYPQPKMDSLLKIHFANIIPLSSYNQRDIVFEDLKSSGRLYIISNDSLRLKIQEYYHHNRRIEIISASNSTSAWKDFGANLYSDQFDVNSI